MSITGSLTDFSVPEILQFIEKGQRTGLLTFRAMPTASSTPPICHYLWVSQGNIVAAANQLNEQGLVQLITQYPWVSDRVVTKLAQFCPNDQPFGLYLKNQGALQAEHLEHLFQVQVVQQICSLLHLKDAHFKFDQNVAIPSREMTGLSVSGGVLEVMWKKLIWLKKLFDIKKQRQAISRLESNSENFCSRLGLVLDIAFFHSLNFSLFNTDNSLAKLSQVFDLYDRPYDLPKSRLPEVMHLTGK